MQVYHNACIHKHKETLQVSTLYDQSKDTFRPIQYFKEGSEKPFYLPVSKHSSIKQSGSINILENEAYLVTYSRDNLFHAFFNAVPYYLTWKRLQLNISSTFFVPYLTEKQCLAKCNGWQMILSTLLNENNYYTSVQRTEHMFTNSNVICFRKIYSSRIPWWPDARNFTNLRNQIPLIQKFKHSILYHHNLQSDIIKYGLVFINREKSRSIHNFDDVCTVAKKYFTTSICTSFDNLDLRQQLTYVSSASGLAGVHGQALTHIAFMPSNRVRCFVLEIIPSSMRNTHAFFDYYRLAVMNNVSLHRYKENVDIQCQNAHFRTCGNMSINTLSFSKKLKEIIS